MALETAFAPAERDSQDQILRQHETLSRLPFIREFLDAVPNMTTVLNSHRQIVFANRAFMEFLGLKTEAQVLGKKRVKPWAVFTRNFLAAARARRWVASGRI